MTKNEKSNTRIIKNAPLLSAATSIFGKKLNQTNHSNKPQTNQMK